MAFANSLHRLRNGLSIPPVELVYMSHPRWPLPRLGGHFRDAPTSSLLHNSELHLAVLDSSFNPPTLAHLALANHHRPNSNQDYDAKLLLLSVTNADKKLKPNDASYDQRVEMMIQLAQDIITSSSPGENPGNVAIAIIDEPTFVGKSRILRAFLTEKLKGARDPKLTFLLGIDTLERLFSPRYYTDMYSSLRKFFAPFPEGENSRVVCATRSPDSYPSVSSSKPILMILISDFLTKENLPADSVNMINIGEELQIISSSAIRRAIGTGSADEWAGVVTERVREYILKEGLYQ